MTKQTERHFVWGAGGVGKSHVVLRLAHQHAKTNAVAVITLDPSLRLLELAQPLPPNLKTFEVLTLKPESLFEEFNRRAPAQPHLKHFYLQMVKSLQQFREYLQLIQLCRFIEDSTASEVVIDTPPFQESGGLLKSMKSLHAFFHQTIVQWAIKTSSSTLLQFGVKKLFDLTRLFVGKKASQSVFDLLSWLTLHSENFKQATEHLQAILSSPLSHHHLILTPETPFSFVSNAMRHLGETQNVHLTINRSCLSYPHPEGTDSFSRMMRRQIEFEIQLRDQIKNCYPHVSIHSISLQLMGDDSVEELSSFMAS